ncbi:uncharacterized protein PHACADRAFT_97651 [Phanerochaete carnosa HHB-10118-sp]|uniref:DUF1168-domain-containing protein n=1 Tax=Phanerochaete carnosa (strain HHB-10118-sp) TaxID=650164 RepID=K5W616_PHACS|nr:uncharacterized protein PHACADRAFT_97651 [Phanerochaete carnosa HHB-10118-sp]EKM54389.1 hypothetical protein PHACADRAFT_97651 [Phanerochaete carnosa HHB-10118-sp]
MSASPAPPSESSTPPVNRHALTAVEKQKQQLEKLLKDPSKSAYVPPPPKEKTIRPPREMMKNVQGSSAGAGSGEFHVYKASRRREYERLKLMDEEAQKEAEQAEFEMKRREWEQQAEAKTAKNRAKRQKKKERAKVKGVDNDTAGRAEANASTSAAPLKKRRLVNGQELVFRRPGEESDDDDDDDVGPQPSVSQHNEAAPGQPPTVPVAEAQRIVIHEED